MVMHGDGWDSPKKKFLPRRYDLTPLGILCHNSLVTRTKSEIMFSPKIEMNPVSNKEKGKFS